MDGQQQTRRQRLITVASGVVAVIALVFLIVVIASKPGENRAGSGIPSSTRSTAATTPTTTSSSVAPVVDFQPLWPFAGVPEAAAWVQSYHSGGHQPWHLDPNQTALSFTQNYLGYTNVDKALSQTISGTEAWVTVGFIDPNGNPINSAMLHLAKLGPDKDAPWEVVGSKDTTLSLTTPDYGSPVQSPVTVGGRITGVDESLRIQLRELDRSSAVGQLGVPAGGQNTTWTGTVPFTGHGVLTIAVSAGGHIATVERFAITGVHT
jgi:hypothetical protein